MPPKPRAELLGLLAACKDAPDEDGPRLVLADWLEDQGESDRAAFVRAQLREAATPHVEPQSNFILDFVNESGELLARHGGEWYAPFAGIGKPTFRRGLGALNVRDTPEDLARLRKLSRTEAWAWIDELSLGHGDFDRDLIQRLAGNPGLAGVSRLDLYDKSLSADVSGEFFRVPWLRALTHLRLDSCNGLTPAMLRAILDGPWERLRSLSLQDTGLRNVEINALALSPLPLRSLDLSHNRITDDAIATLATAPMASSLRRLELSHADLRAASGEYLASRNLCELAWLDLAFNDLGDAGVSALARGEHISPRRLSLESNSVTLDGARSLAHSALLDAAEWFDFSGNRIGDTGVGTLCRSPRLGRLVALRLSSCDFGDGGALAIAASPRLGGLRSLSLSDNAIGPSGASALASSANLSCIEMLNLASNPIRPEGAASLAASPMLTRLRELQLSRCGVGAAGVLALARSPHLRELRRLDVADDGSILDDDTALALAEPENLPNLRVVILGRQSLGEAARRALKDRFGEGVRL